MPQWREAPDFCNHPFIESRPQQKCNSAEFPLDVSVNVFHVRAGSQSEQTGEDGEAARQHFVKQQEGDLTS